MARIVYIAGYGRSGSTLLGILLGNHPDIAYIGEAHNLINNWYDLTKTCSCGQSYSKCEFWREVFPERSSEERSAINKADRLSSLHLLLMGLLSTRICRIYAEYWTDIFNAVSLTTGKSIIVDSSKSTRVTSGRFLALRKLAKQDLFVLHLIRNGLSVMESRVLVGSNLALQGIEHNPSFPALRAAIGWAYANTLAALLGNYMEDGRYMVIRYEDLVSEPAQIIGNIADFVGFDPRVIIEHIRTHQGFQVPHIVAGNRIRTMKEVSIISVSDSRPGSGLGLRHRLLFEIIDGWLNRFYGYRQSREI